MTKADLLKLIAPMPDDSEIELEIHDGFFNAGDYFSPIFSVELCENFIKLKGVFAPEK